jgi:hypothetical protein
MCHPGKTDQWEAQLVSPGSNWSNALAVVMHPENECVIRYHSKLLQRMLRRKCGNICALLET